MKITYREALRLALREALIKEPRAFLMGEDVGAYGGTYAVSKGLLDEFGSDRVIDAPLSELGFTGLGVGAAMGGMRPIIEIMTVNFSFLALDQIVNSAAILRHMSGGQVGVPVVIRMTTGGGRQLAAQHSNSFEGWYSHIPGIKIIAPGTVTDARFMLGEALQDPDPVLIFEHALLLNREEECEEISSSFNAFEPIVRRRGDRLTLVTYGGTLFKAMEASAALQRDGIAIDIIDLRCLKPLRDEIIFESVRKTHRVLVVDEGWPQCSLAAEISSRIMENCFYDLDAPVQRLKQREIPVPYAKHLEEFVIPQSSDIESRVRGMLQ